MFLEQLSIYNFKSFVGRNNAVLKPYSAVMFACERGKNDFAEALQFLFGGAVDKLDDLFNECLLPKFPERIFPSLEVHGVINTRIGETIRLSRAIADNCIVYKVNDSEVPVTHYMTILNGMRSDACFYVSRHDFNEALFETNGIESVISKFIGVDSKLNELQKAVKKYAVLEKALAMEVEKHSIIKLKDQKDVAQLVDEFGEVFKQQESRRQKALEDLMSLLEVSETPSTLSEETFMESETIIPRSQRSQGTPLWTEQDQIEDLLTTLRTLEAEILGKIFYYQCKVLSYEEDISIIQERIALQVKIKEKLKRIEEVFLEIDNDINSIDSELVLELTTIHDHVSSHLTNRLTSYGRLIDWIKPGQYRFILEKVLGNKLNSYLVDTWESASAFIQVFKNFRVETRETFIILSEFSSKLKDTLFANGEAGLSLTNLSDVMILLCKFQEFQLLTDVPVIIKEGNLEQNILQSNALFLSSNEFVRKDGTFGRYDMSLDSDDRSIQDIIQSANTLLKQQEILFNSKRSQLAPLYKLKMDLAYLSEDVRATSKSRATGRTHALNRPPGILPDNIYDEYLSFFNYHYELLEESYPEQIFTDDDHYPDIDILKNTIITLKEELKNVQRNMNGVESQQKAMEDAFCNHTMDSLQLKIANSHPFFIPEPEMDKSLLALDMRMTELKKIISSDVLRLMSALLILSLRHIFSMAHAMGL